MIKKNKMKMLVSSLVILAPMLFGLAVYRHLPEQMAMHWGLDGASDGWGSTALVVFLLPLILLALHWFCVWITGRDGRQQGQNPKVLGIIFWIMPAISLLVNGITYLVAFDVDVPIAPLLSVTLGLLFAVIGNYMPKCTQNRTMGVKVRWTLANEQNWDATHRFAGKVWVFGGIAVMALAFVPQDALMLVLFPLVMAVALAPMVYSYWFYRKQLRQGTATKEDYLWHKTKGDKIGLIVACCVVPLILAGVAVLMFTGGIETRLDADSFTVQATYWEDTTVAYRDVRSVEYLPQGADGTRVLGFASARLQLGTYEGDGLGRYTRYTYTGCDACIVVKTANGTLVLGAADEAQTLALFSSLMMRISK